MIEISKIIVTIDNRQANLIGLIDQAKLLFQNTPTGALHKLVMNRASWISVSFLLLPRGGRKNCWFVRGAGKTRQGWTVTITYGPKPSLSFYISLVQDKICNATLNL